MHALRPKTVQHTVRRYIKSIRHDNLPLEHLILMTIRYRQFSKLSSVRRVIGLKTNIYMDTQHALF